MRLNRCVMYPLIGDHVGSAELGCRLRIDSYEDAVHFERWTQYIIVCFHEQVSVLQLSCDHPTGVSFQELNRRDQ